MTTTTADNQNNVDKKFEGEENQATNSPPLMKEENSNETNDAVVSDDDDKDNKKNLISNMAKKGTKSIIHNTHKGFKQATETTQKGIQQATKTTKGGIDKVTTTTKHGYQQVTKTTKQGLQHVTKTVVRMDDSSTPLLGGKNKNNKSKQHTTDDQQQQQQQEPIKSYDSTKTTTTTTHRVVVEEESKNLTKASPIDVKSSITLEEKQQDNNNKKPSLSAEGAINIYNTPQNTTATTITTTSIIHANSDDEVVPRLLTIIIGVLLTINLYWDAIINQGLVPVYLIPLWFILGIFVCQLFLIRPIIHVIPTTGGGTTDDQEAAATTTGRGGVVEVEVDEFARQRSPRKTLLRYETPIDEPSVVINKPPQTLQTKSTRRDFFNFLRVDKMFSKLSDTVVGNKSAKTTTSNNEASSVSQQHQFHIISTSDFTKYFTNLGNNGKNRNKKRKKNVLWNNMAENNGELRDYLFLNFKDFSKKKFKNDEQQQQDDDEDIDTTAEPKGKVAADHHHHDDEVSSPRFPGKAEEEEEEESAFVDEEEPSMMTKEKIEKTIDNTDTATTTTMGHVSNDNMRAHTLEKDMVIDPLFTLRGIDVFRPNGPADEKIWRQPILEENGLFDVPTFVVNVMLPWYNFVLYFQMPDWVKQFNNITEHPDDTEDIKALKRFLKGDAEYRAPRWKIVPCLVNAPFVIKAIAPVKTAIKIVRPGRLPVSWHHYDEQICPKTGQVTRCALLEADCDLCSDPAIRKILGIVKGQVPRVTIDCAMIIDKPYESKIPEPSACIGLWRLDKIDLDEAAIIPEKDERQLLQEFITIIPEGTELSKSIRILLEKQKKNEDNNEGGLSAVVTAPGITVQA